MASEKVTEVKDQAIAKGEDTKKDVESKVEESKTDSQPGYGDQAKSKADEAKTKASETGSKASSTLTDKFHQAKGKFNDINTYEKK